MTSRKFIIYGEPVSKGRPRFTSHGGYIRTYTPHKTAVYENLVKLSYQQQIGNAELLKGGIKAEIKAFFSIPKSTSKKMKENMVTEKINALKKPDCDNIAKIILDSLNKIAYEDDKQIAELKVEKYYSEIPRVEVELREV